MANRNTKKKRGPKEEVLKAEGVDWQEAMAHALRKSKPKEGWPKPEKKAKR